MSMCKYILIVAPNLHVIIFAIFKLPSTRLAQSLQPKQIEHNACDRLEKHRPSTKYHLKI